MIKIISSPSTNLLQKSVVPKHQATKELETFFHQVLKLVHNTCNLLAVQYGIIQI